MQAQTRGGLIVVGLLALVIVASSVQAQGGTQEVCMTPDLETALTQVVICTVRNAYAYGTMQVVQLELLDRTGSVLRSSPPVELQPLSSLEISHFILAADVPPVSCRVSVLEPLPGYVRAAIGRLDAFGATLVGFPAQCNPF